MSRSLQQRLSAVVPRETERTFANVLQSPMWTYGQTPQFTFSTKPTAEDGRPRPAPPEGVPSYVSTDCPCTYGRLVAVT